MDNNIKETYEKRFRFLQRLYEVTEGSELVSVNLWELGAELGFSRSETDKIDDYLHAEGLIEHIALGGPIGITHRGIVEVETALSKPDQATSYFPPFNYIHVEQMIGSQIQQGTNQSSQVLTNTTNDIEAIAKFITELKDQLPALKLNKEAQAEVEADVETIQSQIKSPRPKSTVIKECLASIRTVLEGIAGNMAAALLMQKMSGL